MTIQVYDHNFEQALLDLGLDARGVAVSEDWEVDTTVLRSWLRKLRGICTHPQVGQLQSQADKLHKPGMLKSMGEVLEVSRGSLIIFSSCDSHFCQDMREKNWRNLMDDWKSKVVNLTHAAQLKQQDDEDVARYRTALGTLLQAEKEAITVIDAVKAAIQEHEAAGKILKAQTAEQRQALENSAGALSKGKDKATERDESPLTEVSEEDSELPKNAVGEEYAHKLRALNSRLRECQISLHKIHFLKGDVSKQLCFSRKFFIDRHFARFITLLGQAIRSLKTKLMVLQRASEV